MTVMDAKVRVVLRIDPFLLCSAVQVFLGQNHQLDVVVADQAPDSPAAVVDAVPERTVQVVLREGWPKFEVTRVDHKEYCQDLATLAGHLNTFAAGSTIGGTTV